MPAVVAFVATVVSVANVKAEPKRQSTRRVIRRVVRRVIRRGHDGRCNVRAPMHDIRRGHPASGHEMVPETGTHGVRGLPDVAPTRRRCRYPDGWVKRRADADRYVLRVSGHGDRGKDERQRSNECEAFDHFPTPTTRRSDVDASAVEVR